MISKKMKLNHVNIGIRVSAKTKTVNMLIAKMTVKSILMVAIAKKKIVQRGTDIHVEIGITKAVAENKVVHIFTKRHTIQEKYTTMEVEAKVTTEV